MSNTTTTWTHPLDYVRGRRWTRAEPTPAPYCAWPRNDLPQEDLHLI